MAGGAAGSRDPAGLVSIVSAGPVTDAKTGETYTAYGVQTSAFGRPKITRRRYSEFLRLHHLIKEEFPNYTRPPFPPKALWGSMSRSTVEQRRSKLQEYLRAVLAVDAIRSSEIIDQFLASGSMFGSDNFVGRVMERLDGMAQELSQLRHVLVTLAEENRPEDAPIRSVSQPVDAWVQTSPRPGNPVGVRAPFPASDAAVGTSDSDLLDLTLRQAMALLAARDVNAAAAGTPSVRGAGTGLDSLETTQMGKSTSPGDGNRSRRSRNARRSGSMVSRDAPSASDIAAAGAAAASTDNSDLDDNTDKVDREVDIKPSGESSTSGAGRRIARSLIHVATMDDPEHSTDGSLAVVPPDSQDDVESVQSLSSEGESELGSATETSSSVAAAAAAVAAVGAAVAVGAAAATTAAVARATSSTASQDDEDEFVTEEDDDEEEDDSTLPSAYESSRRLGLLSPMPEDRSPMSAEHTAPAAAAPAERSRRSKPPSPDMSGVAAPTGADSDDTGLGHSDDDAVTRQDSKQQIHPQLAMLQAEKAAATAAAAAAAAAASSSSEGLRSDRSDSAGGADSDAGGRDAVMASVSSATRPGARTSSAAERYLASTVGVDAAGKKRERTFEPRENQPSGGSVRERVRGFDMRNAQTDADAAFAVSSQATGRRRAPSDSLRRRMAAFSATDKEEDASAARSHSSSSPPANTAGSRVSERRAAFEAMSKQQQPEDKSGNAVGGIVAESGDDDDDHDGDAKHNAEHDDAAATASAHSSDRADDDEAARTDDEEDGAESHGQGRPGGESDGDASEHADEAGDGDEEVEESDEWVDETSESEYDTDDQWDHYIHVPPSVEYPSVDQRNMMQTARVVELPSNEPSEDEHHAGGESRVDRLFREQAEREAEELRRMQEEEDDDDGYDDDGYDDDDDGYDDEDDDDDGYDDDDADEDVDEHDAADDKEREEGAPASASPHRRERAISAVTADYQLSDDEDDDADRSVEKQTGSSSPRLADDDDDDDNAGAGAGAAASPRYSDPDAVDDSRTDDDGAGVSPRLSADDSVSAPDERRYHKTSSQPAGAAAPRMRRPHSLSVVSTDDSLLVSENSAVSPSAHRDTLDTLDSAAPLHDHELAIDDDGGMFHDEDVSWPETVSPAIKNMRFPDNANGSPSREPVKFDVSFDSGDDEHGAAAPAPVDAFAASPTRKAGAGKDEFAAEWPSTSAAGAGALDESEASPSKRGDAAETSAEPEARPRAKETPSRRRSRLSLKGKLGAAVADLQQDHAASASASAGDGKQARSQDEEDMQSSDSALVSDPGSADERSNGGSVYDDDGQGSVDPYDSEERDRSRSIGSDGDSYASEVPSAVSPYMSGPALGQAVEQRYRADHGGKFDGPIAYVRDLPEVVAVMWMTYRECLAVEDIVPRYLKHGVAHAVAKHENCGYVSSNHRIMTEASAHDSIATRGAQLLLNAKKRSRLGDAERMAALEHVDSPRGEPITRDSTARDVQAWLKVNGFDADLREQMAFETGDQLLDKTENDMMDAFGQLGRELFHMLHHGSPVLRPYIATPPRLLDAMEVTPRMAKILDWADALLYPSAAILRTPPFTVTEAPEIVSVALTSLVSVRIAAVLVRKKSSLPHLPDSLIRMNIRSRVLKHQGWGSESFDPAISLDLLAPPDPLLPPAYAWASLSPHVAGALGRFIAAIERTGERFIPSAVRSFVQDQVAAWNGENYDGDNRAFAEWQQRWSQDWPNHMEEQGHRVSSKDHVVMQIALLSALAPRRITKAMLANFDKHVGADAAVQREAVVTWAGYVTMNRVNVWATSWSVLAHDRTATPRDSVTGGSVSD